MGVRGDDDGEEATGGGAADTVTKEEDDDDDEIFVGVRGEFIIKKVTPQTKEKDD